MISKLKEYDTDSSDSTEDKSIIITNQLLLKKIDKLNKNLEIHSEIISKTNQANKNFVNENNLINNSSINYQYKDLDLSKLIVFCKNILKLNYDMYSEFKSKTVNYNKIKKILKSILSSEFYSDENDKIYLTELDLN